MAAMIDEEDDNILEFRINFPLDTPFSEKELLKPDELVTEQHKLNELPFFENFIKNAVDPNESLELNATVGPNGDLLSVEVSFKKIFEI